MVEVIKSNSVQELWGVLGAVLTFLVHHLFKIQLEVLDLKKSGGFYALRATL